MHEARVMIRRIARQRGVREFAQQLYDKIMKACVGLFSIDLEFSIDTLNSITL